MRAEIRDTLLLLLDHCRRRLLAEIGELLARFFDLTFESLDDFNPEAIAKNVGPLKELLDLRTKLADLRGSLQGNDKLEEILQSTLNNAEAMKKLESEVGLQGGTDG